jgi:hypothetical protein
MSAERTERLALTLLHRAALAAIVAVAALTPNNPALGFYAVPEYVCGWLHSDEDQWQCDTDPVAFTPHVRAEAARQFAGVAAKIAAVSVARPRWAAP